jgi:hypothetical protein
MIFKSRQKIGFVLPKKSLHVLVEKKIHFYPAVPAPPCPGALQRGARIGRASQFLGGLVE